GRSRGELARRVRESAAVLGRAGLLERLPRELSGGQRQRVALGRALVRDPAVFLLDEPLSNLDAKLRAGVRTEIARLHRRLGATMIYVTHDQIEAMTLGQRIVVLDRGEPVGNEAFLNTRAGDTELLLRVSPHSLPAPGAEVTLTFSPERLHLFDPETGRRVGRP